MIDSQRSRLSSRSSAITPGRGVTVWLTGLPSSGKTTIARIAAERLRANGLPVEILDGDEVRRHLCRDLGFSREDRYANVTRIGFLAEKLASNGVKVLVPVIAPYADSRAEVRTLHATEGTGFLEVHVDTPLELCVRRDVKGLYAKQSAGEISGLTGVDDPYEPPDLPELRIRTEDREPIACADELCDLLVKLHYA